ncbi:MAG: sterol desaturase family protein [Salibacteraceae bacterium]
MTLLSIQSFLDKIGVEEVLQRVNDLAIIHYAVPVMIGLVFVEMLLGVITNRQQYTGKDLLSSIMIGIGNLITSAMTKTFMFTTVLICIYLSPFRIEASWWSFILCLILSDFARYWAHRVAHEQRIWWATHVPHHSSTNYNFSVSFRLSWVQQVKILFFIPVALMGFDPVMFFIVHQIEVLYQYWIHTEFIRKFPKPIEFIFTTPSHHRVHHATNKNYIDKNYGSTFIIWDRMFGTFQEEQEKVNYGILKPVDSYNPVWLVFHEWVDIFKDLGTYRTPRAWWRILFGGPNMTLDKEHYYGNKPKSALGTANVQIRRSKDEKQNY